MEPRPFWQCPTCQSILNSTFDAEFNPKCLQCGGPAELQFSTSVKWEDMRRNENGVLRYAPMLPVSIEILEKITDRNTPEFTKPIESKKLAHRLGIESVHLFAPTSGPSGTFKDAEAAIAIAKILEWNVHNRLSWHSTGNTARAYREYATRAQLKSDSYFPLTCIGKFRGVKADSENLLIAYDGPFQEISAFAKQRADRTASLHLMPLPWKIEGKATMAYGIFEHLPFVNVVAQTIAGGYGVLGIDLGLQRMQALGLVASSSVRYELFQIDGADTMAKLLPLHREIETTDLRLPVNPFERTLQSTNPLSTFAQVREVVERTDSEISSVLEGDVIETRVEFEEECRSLGLSISYEDEKSPFISWAGLVGRAKVGALKPSDRLALIVTGSKKRTGDVPEPDLILRSDSIL